MQLPNVLLKYQSTAFFESEDLYWLNHQISGEFFEMAGNFS